MTIQGWILILAFVGILLALTRPVGLWLFALYEGRRTPLHAVLGPVERGFYRLAGIDPQAEQSWRRYAVHMLIFNAMLMLFTYAVLRLQGLLPGNPQGLAGVGEHLSFNTAVSFTTNTNWQSYGGESTMSNLSQMLGLYHPQLPVGGDGHRPRLRAVPRLCAEIGGDDRQFLGGCDAHHPLSAAAHLHRLCRLPDRQRRAADHGGRGGRLHPGGREADHPARPGRQPRGDQDARHQWRRLLQRQLRPSVREPDGADGFRADAVDLPDRLRPDMDLRQGGGQHAAGLGDPRRHDDPVPRRHHRHLLAGGGRQSMLHQLGVAGGNMEGKEVRFGIAASALFSVVTTAASCGAVNAMHDSFTALGGLIPLFNIQLGEVVVGGVGARASTASCSSPSSPCSLPG